MAQTPPLRAALSSLGCRVNFSETDHLRSTLRRAGYDLVGFGETADVYIVNTCTVTHVADRKSRRLLRQAARRNPRALVVAIGCYANVAAEALEGLEEVDLVLNRTDQPHLLTRIAAALQARGLPPPRVPLHDGGTLLPAHPTRALIKVQDGCDNSCAYCIVTIARGASRSRPAGEIVTEVQQVQASGYREIILTGVNLGAYRDATVGDLTGLVSLILEQTDIERLRFSSIEPQDFPTGLLDLWPDPRLCRHFHLPLQSGCDQTLARMGRRYRIADFRRLLEELHRGIPDLGVTTDVIVGFPGETEEEFVESRQAIAALPLSDLHIFPFSSRPGTAAASMPHPVHPVVRHERCDEMHLLAQQMAQAFRHRFLGRELLVLWDGQTRQEWTGLSDNYLRVTAAAEGDWLGAIAPVRICSLRGKTLRGEIASPPAELVKSSILLYNAGD